MCVCVCCGIKLGRCVQLKGLNIQWGHKPPGALFRQILAELLIPSLRYGYTNWYSMLVVEWFSSSTLVWTDQSRSILVHDRVPYFGKSAHVAVRSTFVSKLFQIAVTHRPHVCPPLLNAVLFLTSLLNPFRFSFILISKRGIRKF